ncbi:class I SAM-dependent methyltransferase [Oceanicola sp. S124]|uniref:class I SAM-dependent methyltransferase n=1 Tax=Oceanicola sp. S124 TaxID=1042378 RepID=UPI000255968A|nr:SAM-dependent methyltransferase [Oceanicola sp. S124]
MSTLQAKLVARIAEDGPLGIDAYMQACLLDPDFGYYTTRPSIGTDGDFTTAPEISQMFGELLGLSLAQCWMDQGSAPAFLLAELGPGRGTLMADILRATRHVPGFHAAMRILLVEASPRLRAIQRTTLEGFDLGWREDLTGLPGIPLFLVANEFLDALPIRQFRRAEGDLWEERRVERGLQGLTPGYAEPRALPALDYRLGDTRSGDIVEISEAAQGWGRAIGAHVARHGGVALLVDYGGWRSLGDTLQALRDKAPADPFETPGEADLTAHVDFAEIARAALPAAATRLETQGVFLERLGITARAQALAKGLSGAALDSHVSAHRRLTHPEEMGTLFKILALIPPGQRPPPGLEPGIRF